MAAKGRRARGRPIAGGRTRRGARKPEIAGDAGLIVDPFDPAAMAAALEKVWTDAVLRQDLAARALNRAREFTWERCARETLEVLNRFQADYKRL